MPGSNHVVGGVIAPAVDGSALVGEPGRTEGMTVARATIYAHLNGPDLLEACGDSGMKWAEAFQEIVVDAGVKIDTDLMLGWFANAIERSNDKRRWEREAAARGRKDELYTAVFQAIGQASMCWRPRPSGEFDSAAASEIGRDLCREIGAEPFTSLKATATPQDSTSPATSPQSAATAAIRPPTNTTPTPVSADARSHKAPTRTAEE